MRKLAVVAVLLAGALAAQPTKCNLSDCRAPATTVPRIAVLLPGSLTLQFALLDPSIVAAPNASGMLTISAPGGGSTAQPNYADEYTIVTTLNQAVTLGHAPAAGKLFAVYKNGAKMRMGATFDFTLSGVTITPTTTQGFNVGDSINVEYYW